MRAEDDLTSRAREYAEPQIVWGFVGWDDQASHIFDKGTPTGQPGDRHTLLCVTLGGSNTDQLRGPDRGRKIVCCLSSLAGHRIPKKGVRCLVAIPFEMGESPGASVVIATVEDDPERLEDDRRVLDYTGEHVVIKAKSFSAQSDDGEFISVGEPRSGGTSGLTFQAKDGSGGVIQEGVVSWFVAQSGDAKVVLQMTPSKFEVLQKVSIIASNLFRMDGDITISGPGTGFIMPSTIVLGPPGTGTPPYKPVTPATTLSINNPSLHISND